MISSSYIKVIGQGREIPTDECSLLIVVTAAYRVDHWVCMYVCMYIRLKQLTYRNIDNSDSLSI